MNLPTDVRFVKEPRPRTGLREAAAKVTGRAHKTTRMLGCRRGEVISLNETKSLMLGPKEIRT